MSNYLWHVVNPTVSVAWRGTTGEKRQKCMLLAISVPYNWDSFYVALRLLHLIMLGPLCTYHILFVSIQYQCPEVGKMPFSSSLNWHKNIYFIALWICYHFSGNLGEVLIRCNNVLYVRGAEEEDEEGEMKE